MVAVFGISEAEGLVPFEAGGAPVVEPLHLLAGANEELHLHLLELAHTEDELTGHDLIAECLTDLGDTERDAHAACLLHVEIVDEYALGSLGTEVYIHGAVGSGAHLGLEHRSDRIIFSRSISSPV